MITQPGSPPLTNSPNHDKLWLYYINVLERSWNKCEKHNISSELNLLKAWTAGNTMQSMPFAGPRNGPWPGEMAILFSAVQALNKYCSELTWTKWHGPHSVSSSPCSEQVLFSADVVFFVRLLLQPGWLPSQALLESTRSWGNCNSVTYVDCGTYLSR